MNRCDESTDSESSTSVPATRARNTPVPESVVCFDRDHTVSVNPHPERRAVPLSWVKYLAHEDPTVDVWATGNQRLTEEARVPGISEAITCWRVLTVADDPMAYHSRLPTDTRVPDRRDGLELIRTVYDRLAASISREPRFVVVDDVDLTDLESSGWSHYFPWEFAEITEADDGPVDVPTPLDEISNVPLTESSCPESYPPIDYDEPGPLRYL